MIKLLESFNYQPPLIVTGSYPGSVEITDYDGILFLHVDGKRWMAYNTDTHENAYDVYSHYLLAHGHVIVSGLGFGARENWILTKPEVTKLTIIEKTSALIDYHASINSPVIKDPRVEIINCDIHDFQGSCDVLLLDHYETQTLEEMVSDAKVIHDQIEHKTFWFWPFERIIMHSRLWMTECDPTGKLYTKYEAFLMLKQHHKFHNMPDFDSGTINLLCMMHHSTVFSRSELFLTSNHFDRKIHRNIFKSV